MCKKIYQANTESSPNNQTIRLNSQIADLLNNLKNPKHQVKVRCVCGSQKTNLVCLNKSCKFENPSCFDCSDLLHSECDTRLFVNKKKGFEKQIEISKMIRDLRSIEENFKGWISKEITRLQSMLVTVVSNKVNAATQIPKIKCFDFDIVHSSIDKLDVFYSNKQQKVIVSLHNEKKVEHQLSGYMEAIQDCVREHFGRLSTSIKALSLDDFALQPEEKNTTKVNLAPQNTEAKQPSSKKTIVKMESAKPLLENLSQVNKKIEPTDPTDKKFSLMFEC